MAILPANPNDGIDEEDLFQEEGTQYNMRELMDQIYKLNDVIFTIPAEEVELLKRGLIVRKGKDNAKLARNGLKADGTVLSFIVYPAKDKEGNIREGISDVRVKLGPKKAVNVLEIRIPNEDF